MKSLTTINKSEELDDFSMEELKGGKRMESRVGWCVINLCGVNVQRTIKSQYINK